MTDTRYECCFYADLRPSEVNEAIRRALIKLEPQQQKVIMNQAEQLINEVKARNPLTSFSMAMALEAIVKIALNPVAMRALEGRTA